MGSEKQTHNTELKNTEAQLQTPESLLLPEQGPTDSEPITDPALARENEFKKNLHALAQRTEDYLHQKEVEFDLEKLEAHQKPVLVQQRAKHIDAQLKTLQRPQRVTGLKALAMKTRLRFKGSKQPDNLLNTINSLQQELFDTHWHEIEATTKTLEQTKAKLERNGYSVLSVQEQADKPGKFTVTAEKVLPFIFNMRDTKELDGLVSECPNLISVLTTLNTLGISLKGTDFSYGLRHIRSLVKPPEKVQFLATLAESGVILSSGSWSTANIENLDKVLSAIANEIPMLTETVKNTDSRTLEQLVTATSGIQINTLPDFLHVIDKPEAVQLATLSHKLYGDLYSFRSMNIFNRISEMAEAGLVQPVLDLLNQGITPDLDVVFPTYGYSAEKYESHLRSYIDSPEIQELFRDAELMNFTKQASYLTKRGVTSKYVSLYKKLKVIPNALPLLNLIRELDGSGSISNEITYHINAFKSFAQSKEILHDVLNPAFSLMVKELREKLKYRFDLEDLVQSTETPPLVSLFRNPEQQKALLSENGMACIAAVGGLKPSYAEGYVSLINQPELIPLAQTLHKKFKTLGSYYGVEGIFNLIKTLKTISQDNALRDILLSKEMEQLYQELKKLYHYHFSIADVSDLAMILKDTSLRKSITSEETATFLKESNMYFSPKNTRLLLKLRTTLQPVLGTITHEFGYKLDLEKITTITTDTYQKDLEALDRLASDKQLLGEFLKPERLHFIRSIIHNKDLVGRYHFQPQDIDWLLQVPTEVLDFALELQQTFKYTPQVPKQSIETLTALIPYKDKLRELGQLAQRCQLVVQFHLADTDILLKLLDSDYRALVDYYNQLKDLFTKANHPSPKDILDLQPLLEAQFDPTNIASLRSTLDLLEVKFLLPSEIPYALALYQNKESVLAALNILRTSGQTHNFSITQADDLAFFGNNLETVRTHLPEFKQILGYAFEPRFVRYFLEHPHFPTILDRLKLLINRYGYGINDETIALAGALCETPDSLDVYQRVINQNSNHNAIRASDFQHLVHHERREAILDRAEMLNKAGYHLLLRDIDLMASLSDDEMVQLASTYKELSHASNSVHIDLGEALKLSQSPEHTELSTYLQSLTELGYRIQSSLDLQTIKEMVHENYSLEEISRLAAMWMAWPYLKALKSFLDSDNHSQVINFVEDFKKLADRPSYPYSFVFTDLYTYESMLDIKDTVLDIAKRFHDQQAPLPSIDELIRLINEDDTNALVTAYLQIQRHAPSVVPLLHSVYGYYRGLASIPNLEDLVTTLPPSTLEHFSDTKILNILREIGSQPEVCRQVFATIDHQYFKNTSDAKASLQEFISRFHNKQISTEYFVKIMTISKDPRNIKRLFAKIMALQDISKDGSIELDAIESSNDYNEIFATVSKTFVNQALERLYPDDTTPIPRGLVEKIESLSINDPVFEDDFRVMTDSVAIYTKRFAAQKPEDLAPLMDAIRQALELDLIRDPKEYDDQRFAQSADQFERLATLLPENMLKTIQALWKNTQQITTDKLDSTSISEKVVLRNKLAEVQQLFTEEILPELTRLFRDKLQSLEETVLTSEPKKAVLFQIRLDIFKHYLLNNEGETRQDILTVYNRLIHDIAEKEKTLKSPDTPNSSKQRLGAELTTMRVLRDTLKAVYKLSVIDPDHINKQISYAKEIDEIVETLRNNLHRVALVDKEKQPEELDVVEHDLRGHLEQLANVIKPEDHHQPISIATKFVTDFNSLARCPELTGSCQRLSETTGYNESAYSRILDGINELIDVQEVEPVSGQGATQLHRKQRLARCFSELSVIQLPDDTQPQPTVLLDRMYFSPDHSTFHGQLADSIITAALKRFQHNPDLTITLSNQFTGYRDRIMDLAEQYGYEVSEHGQGQYFINESQLKLERGKYYDCIRGHEDTTHPHFTGISSFFLLKPHQQNK